MNKFTDRRVTLCRLNTLLISSYEEPFPILKTALTCIETNGILYYTLPPRVRWKVSSFYFWLLSLLQIKSFLMALMILTLNVKQVSVIALWSTSWHRTKWWMKLTHFSTQVVVMGRPAAARTGRWKKPQDVNWNILSRPGGLIMWWNKNNQKHGAQAKMEWADSKSTVMGETISKASTNQTFR